MVYVTSLVPLVVLCLKILGLEYLLFYPRSSIRSILSISYRRHRYKLECRWIHRRREGYYRLVQKVLTRLLTSPLTQFLQGTQREGYVGMCGEENCFQQCWVSSTVLPVGRSSDLSVPYVKWFISPVYQSKNWSPTSEPLLVTKWFVVLLTGVESLVPSLR